MEPAFPSTETNDSHLNPGLSVRDYFAAKALGSLLTTAPHGTRFGIRHAETANNYALAAYAIADAMLAARTQNPEAA